MRRTHLGTLVRSLALLALALALVVPALAAGPPDGAARKIVVFQETFVNQPAQEALVAKFGGTVIKPLPIVNGYAVLLPPPAVKTLLQHPGVLRVEDDAVVTTQRKPPPPPPPAETLPWGVDRIDADLVWDTNGDLTLDPGANTGNGVKVAVLDTGIDLTHPDLQANIRGGVNTINPLKSANDDNGHGTHVAGIIAAIDNDVGVIGVGPQAHLYAVKVLSRTGSGWVSDIIEGIQWSIQNGMQVINMSFGTSSDVQSFHDALTAAYNAGIVLVAAAGNSGPGDNTVLYPAKYAEVIAVSATDSTDAIASFSSRGPEVELAAPGVSINSTYKGGTYKVLSGTSMASPHAAGTAALVIASGVTDTNGNGLVNDEVRAKLQTTADDLGTAGIDNSYGYGLVDAQEAATGEQTLP
jgi:subtilisin family serine protease